jgi:hypothetical protein
VAQVQFSQWRVTQQAAIFRPNSFPSRPRGPSWTSRRSTRSGQSRPRRRFPPSTHAFASPLRRVELADRGSHIFSPPQREVVHGCAKFFGARAEEGSAMNGQTGLSAAIGELRPGRVQLVGAICASAHSFERPGPPRLGKAGRDLPRRTRGDGARHDQLTNAALSRAAGPARFFFDATGALISTK